MKFTYSVFLLRPIISFTDTNAEALIANGLIGALSYRLSALVRNVASHLWRHWRQLELARTIELSEVCGLLRAAEGRNWQLKCASGRLRHALSSDTLWVIGCLRGLDWQNGSQYAWLGGHELRSHLLMEAWAGLLAINNHSIFAFFIRARAHVASS